MTAALATVSSSATETREEWLTRAVDALRPLFAEVGETVPAVRVSVGFPGGGSARKRIGECWAPGASVDGVAQLFVSPIIGSAVDALAVLVHELIHAIDECKSGHKGAFRKVAVAVGLTGKMTATVAGPDLAPRLAALASSLGDYPHAALTLAAAAEKKQTTRMLKVECPDDGYTIRTTAKWLAVGNPSCPCGTEMVAAEAGE